ncbi:MAG: hypothetical protein JXB19_09730 [Bacteroidales bacterium]|nr:hypothetical protein [Bacteroidales bacterium]
MNHKLKKILIGLTAITVIILGLGVLLFNTILDPYYFSMFPYLVLIFMIVNAAFFIFFFHSMKKTNTQFIRNFMGASGIKTIFYFFLVLAYILTTPQHAIPFSVTLLVLYIIYTAYDLYVTLKLLRRKKEKNTLPNHMSN